MTHSRFFKNVLDKLRQPSGGVQIDSSWISVDIGLLSGSTVSPVGVSVVDWTIPAAVQRLTLLSSGLESLYGTIVRLGVNDGVVTTGYNSANHYIGPSTGLSGISTVGLMVPECGDGAINSFCMTFYRVSPNTWNAASQGTDGTDYVQLTYGNVQLPGELTTVRYVSPAIINSGSLRLLWEF